MEEGLRSGLPGISVAAASDDEIDSKQRMNEHRNNDCYFDDEPNDNDGNFINDDNDNAQEDIEISRVAEQLHGVEIDTGNVSFGSSDIVSDRILIERDGKFELIDAAEVKAEYFQMMGIEQDLQGNALQEEKPALNDCAEIRNSHATAASSNIDARKEPKRDINSKTTSRPKTSPVKVAQNKDARSDNVRANSANITQRHNEEYAHIKSRYAMTDHQLEMKRRREEAIARRKKEEEERQEEEMKRKRDDAERAFQAWLKMKNEEALERRKLLSEGDEKDKEERNKAAQDAYEIWLHEKTKQRKQEKEVEKKKLEEEASLYIIREREACEEAFNRWLKTKRDEEKKKLVAMKKPKRQRRGRKKRPTEPPRINTSSIRFTDYYGYRHTVAL